MPHARYSTGLWLTASIYLQQNAKEDQDEADESQLACASCLAQIHTWQTDDKKQRADEDRQSYEKPGKAHIMTGKFSQDIPTYSGNAQEL